MTTRHSTSLARWQWWATAVVVWPVVWVAAEYTFILIASSRLGHWPRPGEPDPHNLGFRAHEGLLAALLLGYPVIVIGALAATVVYASRGVRLPWLRWALAWWAILLGVLALHVVDPGGGLGWLAD